MATRDEEARNLVAAVQTAQAMLGQTLPEMVAARPPDVVVPPGPQLAAGPDGTVQVIPPVLGGTSGGVYPNMARRRY